MPIERPVETPFVPEEFYSDAKDYTFYKAIVEPRAGELGPVEEQLRMWAGKTDGFSYDCQAAVGEGGSGPRLLACRSFQNRWWSCTGREECKRGGRRAQWEDPASVLDSSTYKPDPVDEDLGKRFLFPTEHIVDMLSDVFELEKAEPNSGLLIVAGATKSAKTTIARGLIFRRLRAAAIRDYARYSALAACHETRALMAMRLQHLVTFEDPIERFFWSKPALNHLGVLDYTPRQYRLDAASLKAALTDALRQVPSVFYIGEVRQWEDWRDVIEFAGTGHLVVATAHGGSLTEAMVKIFKSVGAETAAARKYVADRILGAIHVRLESNIGIPAAEQPGRASFQGAVVGSLWRRTQAGIHALTSDGFTSLLPTNPHDGQVKPGVSCLGQCWWAKRQFAALVKAGGLSDPQLEEVKRCKPGLLQRLLGRDLEGEVGA